MASSEDEKSSSSSSSSETQSQHEVKSHVTDEEKEDDKRDYDSGLDKEEQPPAVAVVPDEEDSSIRILHTNNTEKNAKYRYPNNFVKTSKYTIFTFIPKNLIEQFMRAANVYFLFISGLQQIPGISPTGRWTTLGPLLVVLAFTALKEAFEDIKRHRQDNEINSRKVSVLRGNDWVDTRWEDVLVGDILKIENRTYIPADMILISSSEPQGMCYIETANLDGETNLKSRQSLVETHEMLTVDALRGLTDAVIKCDLPNNRLYHFSGSIQLDHRTYPLETKQILLRGAMLRNTKFAYGVAIYTGHDTKLMKNASKAPVKRTNVERVMNLQILFMFCLLLFMAFVSAIGNGVWQGDIGDNSWYLEFTSNAATGGALAFLTFVILYNNLIPISLYVSVEIVKFGQAYFINNDVKMYHAESDTPALARTSNLNEELGQVQYIFSDKTGTLTCNKMEFRKCSIGGIIYGSSEENNNNSNNDSHGSVNSVEMDPVDFYWTDDALIENMKSHATKDIIKETFTLLSVCHTVIPEVEKDKVIYQASSPDEAALVKAAKYFGFNFHKRTPKTVTVQIGGKDFEYKILNVLEFTNVRKRMSVIVRTEDNRILLYCKGADTVIFPRLSTTNNPYVEATTGHLDDFAREGLRTLILAYVELDETEYQKWNVIFDKAATSINNREQNLEEAAELIEKDMILLGASAVEDQLQKGVPETIATLLKAGIKIWVLTGDKQETAINIGYSCRLLNQNQNIMIINTDSLESTAAALEQKLNECNDFIAQQEDGTVNLPQVGVPSEITDKLALVINGESLHYALSESLQLKLLELAMKCKAVICCRVTPGQKAAIVKLVRNNLKAISLAIGDGANDVAMIQAAHVGVGISGEEGLQAARAADYSIAQFRFLQRLLLVHGRSSYRRISKVILYSFYKNILLYFTQFWFIFFSGFSGQSLFERWTLATYNVIFTLFPVLFYGLLDKDVNERSVIANPKLYLIGINKYHFNSRTFWSWVMTAIFHSFIAFSFPTLAFSHGTADDNGTVSGLTSVGTTIYTCVVIIVSFKLIIEARHWTWLFQAVVWLSILAWILWQLIYGIFWLQGAVDFGSDFLFVPYRLWETATYWLVVPLTVFVAMYRDVVW
eukprot:CAMPEP_0168565858 /NCGR_PEP_ID=MMETSP0413-20121227/14088_1 /TAXON_ID=136452 /ORGANISM="Filamoeba nolandi, Strain NC-AS-23-1" /LENGTH=1122 /DNA_ID=CAMNT_0008597795 /DNA_START=123 /DNA_END=3488 /DNA_ORIENTATION=+